MFFCASRFFSRHIRGQAGPTHFPDTSEAEKNCPNCSRPMRPTSRNKSVKLIEYHDFDTWVLSVVVKLFSISHLRVSSMSRLSNKTSARCISRRSNRFWEATFFYTWVENIFETVGRRGAEIRMAYLFTSVKESLHFRPMQWGRWKCVVMTGITWALPAFRGAFLSTKFYPRRCNMNSTGCRLQRKQREIGLLKHKSEKLSNTWTTSWAVN